MAGQPLLPPFPNQVLPPLPFCPEAPAPPPPPPPSSVLLSHLSGDMTPQTGSNASEIGSEQEKGLERDCERPSREDAPSASDGGQPSEVGLSAGESICLAVSDHHQAQVRFVQVEVVEMAADTSVKEASQSSECSKQLSCPTSIHGIEDSHILSALYSPTSDACQSKNHLHLSTESQPIVTYSTTVQSPSQLCTYSPLSAASVSSAGAEPSGSYSLM